MNATSDEEASIEAVLPTLVIIAAVFTFLNILISAASIIGHLKNFYQPEMQRYIVRILLIVPIYGICSLASLANIANALYYDIIRDCYVAYVIYLFMALITAYCGGDSMLASLLAEKGRMPHPFPLCRLKPLRLGASFMRMCKQGTLQFVVLKPIMAVISIALLSQGLYENPVYQWILMTIYNISYTVALFVLGYFYLATRDMIWPFRPVYKFLAVKMVILFTYWQGLIVFYVLPFPTEEALMLNDFILCVEMLGFALLHRRAFAPDLVQQEHKAGGRGSAQTPPSAKFMSNVRNVVSVKDVAEDIGANFSRRSAPIENFSGVALLDLQDSAKGKEDTVVVHKDNTPDDDAGNADDQEREIPYKAPSVENPVEV